MVVAFHSFIAYLAWPLTTVRPFDSPPYDWTGTPIMDGARWFGFDLFCALQYLYLMHLMFLLSGLFVWPSLQRKGIKSFLSDRILRLGVPFLLGTYLLMPVAYYPAYAVVAVDPSLSAFWSHWTTLPFWPSGPMWFLWFLLLLNIAAAGLHRLAPGAGEHLGRLADGAGAHPGRFLVALAIVSAVAYVPLALIFRPWEWAQFGPFSFQPSFTLQYVLFFFVGVALGANGLERGLLRADGTLARQWGRWLAGAAAAFLMWICPTALIVDADGRAPVALQVLAELGFVLSSATTCFGLVAAFLRFSTVTSPSLASFSENAYGIYLVHYVFVVWLQYALLNVPLHALVKAAIVLAGALLLSWAASAAICHSPVGARLLWGKGRVSARAPATAKTR